MTLKNRKEILARLIEIPEKGKRPFWSREMMFLKKLEKRYSLEFLKIVTFPKKYDSLAYLISNALKPTMDRKWKNFNFKVDFSKYESYDIGEKFGKDFKLKKDTIKNTKKFLNE
jgi:hypothetical protein